MGTSGAARLRTIKAALEYNGFEVSKLHYCKGGPAVMGEVSLHARIGAEAIYVCAYADLLPGGPQIMYRFEEWPEYLGGVRHQHKRMGANHYTSFAAPSLSAIMAVRLEGARAI